MGEKELIDHCWVFWRPSWILTTLGTFFQKSVGTTRFLGKFQSRTNFKHKVNTISLKSPDERLTKSTGPITVILHMFSKVASCAFSGFWTLTLKLTQRFDLIYDIGKSDWNILLNIMKTAKNSCTITIKQIVRFQERMHLENFQVDKI